MATPDLTGKRVLVLGAETEHGRAVANALADAGARLALVTATPDAGAAFAVQRLARRLSATAQAIDVTNEMAVRVMIRQVSKQFGGLDAVVFSADLGERTADAFGHVWHFAGREMSRSRNGIVVMAVPGFTPDRTDVTFHGVQERLRVVMVQTVMRMSEDVAAEAVRAVAGEATSG